MATLKISGHSDDLIEIDGTVSEEFYAGSDGMFEARIKDPEGNKARLFVTYGPQGTWIPVLALWDEGVALPDWDARITSDVNVSDYSTILTLTVPDGTKIKVLEGGEKGRTLVIK